MIRIFNRSHYEDVLIVRVHGWAPADLLEKRYKHINDFERALRDHGTHVVKVMLHISPETGSGPRRTIRLALWTGEEQGLYGSRAYIKNNVAERGAQGERPVATLDQYEKISAYYNMDNGTGKIRGVYRRSLR